MLRHSVTQMKILTLAGLGLFLVAGPANAQQGWPTVGSNWDTTGGSSRGSYRSSYSGGYSPSYYSSSAGSYSLYNYPATRSGEYNTSSTDAGKRPARINLQVPGDAEIWFDANQTSQTGTVRSFESPPLDAGSEYAYQIRVQWKQDGKDITETRHVNVHSGDVINLTLRTSRAVAMAH